MIALFRRSKTPWAFGPADHRKLGVNLRNPAAVEPSRAPRGAQPATQSGEISPLPLRLSRQPEPPISESSEKAQKKLAKSSSSKLLVQKKLDKSSTLILLLQKKLQNRSTKAHETQLPRKSKIQKRKRMFCHVPQLAPWPNG